MSATKTYLINEIFYSLQGEGYHTGTPAVFVRFSGCNLHCEFCDTDFSNHTTMTAKQIVDTALSLIPATSINTFSQPIVVLTGGEPAMQLDDQIIRALHDANFYIAIETNGTRTVPNDIDWITCSPKTHFGQSAQAQLHIQHIDELKVVFNGSDIEPFLRIPADHYYLQPMETITQINNQTITQQNTAQTIAYIMQHPFWQLSLQTHKYLNIR